MTGNAFASATSLGHGGRQDYGTPQAFIDVVARHFGPIAFDLAAHQHNHKAARWYGPGGEAEDSLTQDWVGLYVRCASAGQVLRADTYVAADPYNGDRARIVATVPTLPPLLWLNPEFSHMKPWVKKCHESALKGARIALLAPANVGAAWWWDYVLPSAHVLILSPRLAFDGAPVRGKISDLQALNGALNWSPYIVGKPNKGSLSLDPRFWLDRDAAVPPEFKALPFPGPLMLALYGCGQKGRLSRWLWKE